MSSRRLTHICPRGRLAVSTVLAVLLAAGLLVGMPLAQSAKANEAVTIDGLDARRTQLVVATPR